MQQNNREFSEVSSIADYSKFLFFKAIDNVTHLAIAYIDYRTLYEIRLIGRTGFRINVRFICRSDGCKNCLNNIVWVVEEC